MCWGEDPMSEPLAQIGDWYVMCCWRDVCQITTQEELDEFREDVADGMWSGITYPTQESAIRANIDIHDPSDEDLRTDWEMKFYPEVWPLVRQIALELRSGKTP